MFVQINEYHKLYDITDELKKADAVGEMWYTAVTEYRELHIRLQAGEWEPIYGHYRNNDASVADFSYIIVEGNGIYIGNV